MWTMSIRPRSSRRVSARLLAVLTLAALANALAVARAGTGSLRERVGVVWESQSTVFFATSRASLPAGTLVTVIDVDTMGARRALRVVGAGRRAPDADLPVSIDGVDRPTVYRLRGRLPSEDSGVCVGVAGPEPRVEPRGGALTCDVDGDGLGERISSCTSGEGFHIMIRAVGDRRLRWHAYYHFDFEVEQSDCTDDDLR